MDESGGSRIFVHGRLRGITKERLNSTIGAIGAELVRKAGSAGLIVVAESTAALVGGEFAVPLPRGVPDDVPVASEGGLKRRLGLLPPLPAIPRNLSHPEVARGARVSEQAVACLAAFDVLSPAEGRFSFGDLRAAREVGRAVEQGFRPGQILQAALQLSRSGQSIGNSRLAASPWDDGEIVQEVRGQLGTLLGQLALPFERTQPSIEEMFEMAEEREQDGDLLGAERWYRLATKVDRTDPVLPFNLGNVLDEQGRPKEAALAYHEALARDPSFPEAWFNLAVMAERDGDLDEARKAYERAVAVHPEYPDGLYNLARLLTEIERFAEAEPVWERFVALAALDKRLKRAKRYLGLCRLTLAEVRSQRRSDSRPGWS